MVELSPFDLTLVYIKKRFPGKESPSPSRANFRERFYVKRVDPLSPSQQLIYP